MSDQVKLGDLPEAEINKKIVEITIKIGAEEQEKKIAAEMHNDALKDYKATRNEYVDEILRRRR